MADKGDDLPESDDGVVTICGANFHTITLLGDGSLFDLKISQRGSGQWFALHCAAGSPKVSNCDIDGATSSCIGICGGSAPAITNCRVHGSEHGCGVCAFEGGKGELEGNEIFSNAMSGVEACGEETEISLKGNRVHSNRGDGVLLYDSAKATLTENNIERNFHAGDTPRTTRYSTLLETRVPL